MTSTTTQAVAPGPLTASEQVCVDYGFTPGTGAYDRCVSREHAARVIERAGASRPLQASAAANIAAVARAAAAAAATALLPQPHALMDLADFARAYNAEASGGGVGIGDGEAAAMQTLRWLELLTPATQEAVRAEREAAAAAVVPKPDTTKPK